MSFVCDNCGKNSVKNPGEWCSECQKREHYSDIEADAEWFGKSRLCQTCLNADGPYSNDKCIEYDMPLYMVARRNKCKHYKHDDGSWDGEW